MSYIILPLNVDTLLTWPVARIHCWSHDAEGKLPYIFNCKYALHLPGYYTQWNITYVLSIQSLSIVYKFIESDISLTFLDY